MPDRPILASSEDE
jgi:hypothetical protein